MGGYAPPKQYTLLIEAITITVNLFLYMFFYFCSAMSDHIVGCNECIVKMCYLEQRNMTGVLTNKYLFCIQNT